MYLLDRYGDFCSRNYGKKCMRVNIGTAVTI